MQDERTAVRTAEQREWPCGEPPRPYRSTLESRME